ncbi:hypothetical protein HK100_010979 [Physocladia obscura]|uniref:Uncharacterized protein n=1 Tax=Physocladia obscura TaxID=109957 RepID=A0AAD5T8S7_9FUNG|nr:hypothetical protein HK100_010979 [Physocladia obscura]
MTKSLEFKLYPWIKPRYSSVHHMRTAIVKNSVGIIILCAKSDYFHVTAHLVESLRLVLKVALPIQIYYSGHDENSFSLNKNQRDFLSLSTGVTVLSLHDYYPAATTPKKGCDRQEECNSTSFLKPFAILASNFSTVLYMDPGTFFLLSPIYVLDSQSFQNTGIVIYRSKKTWLPHHGSPYVSRYVSGNTGGGYMAAAQSVIETSEPNSSSGSITEMDGGFIVVDKARPGVFMSIMAAAAAAVLMNSKELMGKKKSTSSTATFLMDVNVENEDDRIWRAMEVLRVPFKFNPSYSGVIGVKDMERSIDGFTVICGENVLQLNEENQPFWVGSGGISANHYVMSELLWMAAQFNWTPDQLLWLDKKTNCMRQATEKTSMLNRKQTKLIEEYRKSFVKLVS